MENLKKGDKVICFTKGNNTPINLCVRTIEKVNKVTYRFVDGSLVYKDGREYGLSGVSWHNRHTTYYPYTKEKYLELKTLFFQREYEIMEKELNHLVKRYGKGVTIDALTKYLVDLAKEGE